MKGANKLRNEKISMSLLWISYLQCPGRWRLWVYLSRLLLGEWPVHHFW